MKRLSCSIGIAAALLLSACQNTVFKNDMPMQANSAEEISALHADGVPVTIWKTLKQGDYEVIIALQDGGKSTYEAFHEKLPRQSFSIYARLEGQPYKLISALQSPESPNLNLKRAFWDADGMLIIETEEEWPALGTGKGTQQYLIINLEAFDLQAKESHPVQDSFTEIQSEIRRMKKDAPDIMPETLKGQKAQITKYENGTVSITLPPYKRTYHYLKDAEYSFYAKAISDSTITVFQNGTTYALSVPFWDYPLQEFRKLEKETLEAQK